MQTFTKNNNSNNRKLMIIDDDDNDDGDGNEDDDVLVKDNKDLREQIVGLETTLNSKHDGEIIGMLDCDELKILEREIMRTMKRVFKAKMRLMEEKTLCIACLDRQKTIVIPDCGHFDLCGECFDKLPKRICPRCQQSFEDIFVMQFK